MTNSRGVVQNTRQENSENRIETVLITEGDDLLASLVSAAMLDVRIRMQPKPLDMAALHNPDEIEALCLTVRSPVGVDEMSAMPNLRIIITGSAGYDHIDIAVAESRGITVCNTPKYGPAVAEFNMALLLSLARRLHIAYANTLRRNFSIDDVLGVNLRDKQLGIIGAGNIGATLSQIAGAFGMRTFAYDPYPNPNADIEYVTLSRLLQDSDFIAICCPLTPSTMHMIGMEEFQQMKRGVQIVNTSRGAVIDTQALLVALEEGIVAGAALDVLEAETMLPRDALLESLGGDEDSGTDDVRLLRHPRVLVTPHIAYYTEDSLAAIRQETARILKKFAEGEPVNAVTRRPKS